MPLGWELVNKTLTASIYIVQTSILSCSKVKMQKHLLYNSTPFITRIQTFDILTIFIR